MGSKRGSGTGAIAILIAAPALAGPPIAINEVDSDQVMTDNAEFVELHGPGGTSLTGLVLVLFNGATDTSYGAFDLDGHTIPPNGFFVLGSAIVPNVDLVVFSGALPLQNGPDGVALYTGNAANFPNGTAATAVNLIDAVVYGNDPALLAALGAAAAPEDSTTSSVGRLPDGTGSFVMLDPPSPGTSNGAQSVALLVDKEGPSVASAGAPITYTIVLENDGSGNAKDVTVVDTLPAGLSFVGWSTTPPGALTLDDATEPTIGWSTALLPPGSGIILELQVMIGAEVAGTIVNVVDVATSTPGDDPGDNQSSVPTEIAPALGIIVNEILADPALSGLDGDANGDGVSSGNNDEFVEIVNDTGAELDLSGWTLADLTGVRHIFEAGTVVDDGCAVVVFGGGVPIGKFGNVEVQVASQGQLNLNNAGDAAVLRDDVGTLMSAYSYGEEANADQSITRDPDITGPVMVGHIGAAGSGGARFSPGTRVDGMAFDGCPGPVEPPANLFINEIRIDQMAGAQDPDEFFELKGDSGTELSGLTYLVIGDGAELNSGVIEMTLDLDGSTIPADGLFVVVEETFIKKPIFFADLILSGGELFEDADNVTHLLVANFSGAVGQDLDANNDGALDFVVNPELAVPWSDVVDAVGILQELSPPSETEFTYAAFLGFDEVGPDADDTAPPHVYRCDPAGDWLIGPLDKFDPLSTPGAPNPGGCPVSCPADVNGDGEVDVQDLVEVIIAWDSSDPDADVDGSGIVDVQDLVDLILAWGKCA